MEARLPKREEVAVELTWKLEDIFPDNEAWEKERQDALAQSDVLKAYEGRLAESAAVLLEALKLYESLMLTMTRVGGYSHMRHDEDTGNALYQELDLKTQGTYVKVMETLAFLEPEILAITDEKLDAFYAQEPRLKYYELSIREMRRMKEHTLTKEMEQLLASAGEMSPLWRNSRPNA